MSNPQEEADKLRHEAKQIIKSVFNNFDGHTDETLERLIDCIISAAVLETVAIYSQSAKNNSN